MSVQRVSVIRVNPNRSSTIRAHPYKPNQIEIQSAPPSNGSNNNWNRQTFQVQESTNRSSIPVRRSPILVQQVRVTTQRKPQSVAINNQSVIMQHQNPIDIAIKQEIESCNNNQTTEMVKNIQVFNQIQTTTSKQPMNRGSISPSSFMKSRDDSDFEANHLKKKGPIPKLFDNERCKVCGDKASGFHYQVVSCEGCKGFFRRSILASKLYVCKYKVQKCMDDPYMRRRCQFCRLVACYEAGMKSEFVQKVRNETSGKTSKAIAELNRLNKSLSFKQVISPLQNDLVQDVQNFWTSFCHGPDKMIAKLGETIEPSSRNKQHEYERKLKEKLEKLVASCQIPPWSNNQTNSGLESRYQHMVAVGKLHHNSIYCMSDIISQFKMLETSTKNILVKGSSLELMIIRAAFLKQNGGVPAVITGEIYTAEDFLRAGLDESRVQEMEETINAFINHNFDDFEFALMACMVLVSPDRGGTINIAEHRALGTIQECLAAILETKLHKDGKDIKYFSSCLYLLTRLRSFSELLQPMWETILDSR